MKTYTMKMKTFMKNRKIENKLTVTRTQVELAFFIRQFRRIHELSQIQMAKICTVYGKPYNEKFYSGQICDYENYKHMPNKKRFQILLNTMDISEDML